MLPATTTAERSLSSRNPESGRPPGFRTAGVCRHSGAPPAKLGPVVGMPPIVLDAAARDAKSWESESVKVFSLDPATYAIESGLVIGTGWQRVGRVTTFGRVPLSLLTKAGLTDDISAYPRAGAGFCCVRFG
jgi:hypothetical protein